MTSVKGSKNVYVARKQDAEHSQIERYYTTKEVALYESMHKTTLDYLKSLRSNEQDALYRFLRGDFRLESFYSLNGLTLLWKHHVEPLEALGKVFSNAPSLPSKITSFRGVSLPHELEAYEHVFPVSTSLKQSFVRDWVSGCCLLNVSIPKGTPGLMIGLPPNQSIPVTVTSVYKKGMFTKKGKFLGEYTSIPNASEVYHNLYNKDRIDKLQKNDDVLKTVLNQYEYTLPPCVLASDGTASTASDGRAMQGTKVVLNDVFIVKGIQDITAYGFPEFLMNTSQGQNEFGVLWMPQRVTRETASMIKQQLAKGNGSQKLLFGKPKTK